MAKQTSKYYCETPNCGRQSNNLIHLCPGCHEYDTYKLKSNAPEPKANAHITATKLKGTAPSKARRIGDVAATELDRIDTKIGELNRVLGGGLVEGSVVLLGGDPGQGKSTLLLMTAALMSRSMRVLYVSGEEREEQIKMRFNRLGLVAGDLYLVYENNLEMIMDEHIVETRPQFVIIDSIHKIASGQETGAAGQSRQLMYCETTFSQYAKSTGVPFFIISQVTKEGVVMGTNALTHAVDTVLYLEGDKQLMFRLLRAEKNRNGDPQEVGVFEMTETGLIEVPNPSAAFLQGRSTNRAGSSVFPMLEGQRTMIVEFQALTNQTAGGTPARDANGIDAKRLKLVAAVLDKHISYISLWEDNIMAAAMGGMKVTEPASDLALALAITSSWHEKPVPAELVAIGEVGLTGDLHNVFQIELRLKEADKLGFTKAIIPVQYKKIKTPKGMEVIQCKTVDEALRITFAGKIDFDVTKRPRKPRKDEMVIPGNFSEEGENEEWNDDE